MQSRLIGGYGKCIISDVNCAYTLKVAHAPPSSYFNVVFNYIRSCVFFVDVVRDVESISK